MYSVCNRDGKSASLSVLADKNARRIVVKVEAYGFDSPISRIFPADQYGDALDFYEGLCEQIEG